MDTFVFDYDTSMDTSDNEILIKKIQYAFTLLDIEWIPIYSELFLSIKDNYITLSFHNFNHAYEVFHTGVLLLLNESNLLMTLNSKEKLTFCIVLFGHDINHRGLTNIQIHNEIFVENNESIKNTYMKQRSQSCNSIYDKYIECKDKKRTLSLHYEKDILLSYNEQHHMDILLSILNEYDIDVNIRLFKKLLHATDLSNHNYYLNDEYNGLIVFMKISDLGHIFRPFHIHTRWVLNMNEERSNNLELHDIPNDTIQFFTIYLYPILRKIENINPTFYNILLSRYQSNINIWGNM